MRVSGTERVSVRVAGRYSVMVAKKVGVRVQGRLV